MEQEILNIKQYVVSSDRNLENYKSLRVNIEFCGDSPKAILVTSSIPGEGKSTVAFKLAKEMAQSGKSVLFLDVDLRNSRFAEMFGISKNDRKGVSDFLAQKVTFKDVMKKTDISNLYMVLSGTVPPNPAELLGSAKFEAFLNVCRDSFDYVIIDSPPLASVIDAAVICRQCDGVIFVIASDMVSCRIIKRALQQIERAGGKLLGAVLNKIKFSNRALYGTYGTNKYYYSSYSNYYK